MMNSVIYNIYESRFSRKRVTDPDIQARRSKQLKRHESLIEAIKSHDPALVKELLALLDEQTVVDLEELPEHFAEGFCLGAKLMIEVLTEIS